MPPTPIAIIAGVGPGTGAAVARRFAKAYPVALLARTPASYEPLVAEITNAGGTAHGFSTDVADQASVSRAFDAIRAQMGGPHGVAAAAAVFNASGGFVRKPFLEMSMDAFETSWGVSVRGAVHFAQAALPLLLAAAPSPASEVTDGAHPPTLVFTGATASIKSNAMMSSFSTGKYALRALSQSLAKEFGPKGVHVAHAVIDGVIDIPRTKEWMKEAGPDAKIDPDGIAEVYWGLHAQRRSAFVNEVDVRPFVEKW